jgi:hypothetical protein
LSLGDKKRVPSLLLTTAARDPNLLIGLLIAAIVCVVGRLYRPLIDLCYVDETIERKGFPCSWEWSVWAGWAPTSFAA